LTVPLRSIEFESHRILRRFEQSRRYRFHEQNDVTEDCRPATGFLIGLVDPEFEGRDALIHLLTDYEQSSTLDFESYASLVRPASAPELFTLLRILSALISNDLKLAEFLLFEDIPDHLLRKCQSFFADAPQISLSLLESLEFVMTFCGDLHRPVLQSSYFSFPFDLIQRVSGDFFCCVDLDRQKIEATFVSACLSVIASFFHFDAQLNHDQLIEVIDVLRGSFRSSHPSIQKSAIQAVVNAFDNKLCEVLPFFSIGMMTDALFDFIESPTEFVQNAAIQIARAIADHPDERNAEFLLAANFLDALDIAERNTHFQAMALKLLKSLTRHDGQLVGLVLQSRVAADAIQGMVDQPFAIRAEAFDFCVGLLKYPQVVGFVLQNPEMVALIVQMMDDVDASVFRTFCRGMAAALFYAQELGVIEPFMAVLADAGLPEIFFEIVAEAPECDPAEFLEIQELAEWFTRD
jgi:hypothetical protein